MFRVQLVDHTNLNQITCHRSASRDPKQVFFSELCLADTSTRNWSLHEYLEPLFACQFRKEKGAFIFALALVSVGDNSPTHCVGCYGDIYKLHCNSVTLCKSETCPNCAEYLTNITKIELRRVRSNSNCLKKKTETLQSYKDSPCHRRTAS